MDFLSAAAGVGMDLASGFANNAFAMRRQEQAQHFSADMFQNRYQMTVADLKAAGLNPMLAYMQGPGSSPTSGATSAQGVDLKGAVNESRIASAQEGMLESQKNKNVQETLTSAAQERNLDADSLVKAGLRANLAAELVQIRNSAEQTHWVTERIKQEIPVVMKQLEEINSRIQKNKSDVALNNSQIQLNARLNELRTAEIYLTGSQTQKNQLEADVLSPKAKAAKMASGQGAAIADNIGKYGKAAWSIMFPSLMMP